MLLPQACNLCNNGNNGVHSQHGAKVVLKGCALDRNAGSGAYGCGVPIHARPGGMCFGNTKSPGADLELTACRMRYNAESGMTVVHKAHGKVFRCLSNQNGMCGVAVMSANATIDRTVCMNNTQHGLVVESAGWANVSRGNLSCNVQDGESSCHLTIVLILHRHRFSGFHGREALKFFPSIVNLSIPNFPPTIQCTYCARLECIL